MGSQGIATIDAHRSVSGSLLLVPEASDEKSPLTSRLLPPPHPLKANGSTIALLAHILGSAASSGVATLEDLATKAAQRPSPLPSPLTKHAEPPLSAPLPVPPVLLSAAAAALPLAFLSTKLSPMGWRVGLRTLLLLAEAHPHNAHALCLADAPARLLEAAVTAPESARPLLDALLRTLLGWHCRPSEARLLLRLAAGCGKIADARDMQAIVVSTIGALSEAGPRPAWSAVFHPSSHQILPTHVTI